MVEVQKDGFEISTDPLKLDVTCIHNFLKTSYWAKGIPMEIVKKSLENSLCFGLYNESRQIGFARLITDRSTFAYLADVFVLEDFRGQGLAKWLMECIINYPDLQGIRSCMLATADAHGLYEAFGFEKISNPEKYMVSRNFGKTHG